jgi:hypothetical protein
LLAALCAIPFEALGDDAVPDEATIAMFTQRLRLTRQLVDMAAETARLS